MRIFGTLPVLVTIMVFCLTTLSRAKLEPMKKASDLMKMNSPLRQHVDMLKYRFVVHQKLDTKQLRSSKRYVSEQTRQCQWNEYKCSDGSVCIPNTFVCDFWHDCRDMSDEQDCEGCSNNEYVCRNGNCIPDIWRCDDVYDCTDKSDEEMCHVQTTSQLYSTETTFATSSSSSSTTQSYHTSERYESNLYTTSYTTQKYSPTTELHMTTKSTKTLPQTTEIHTVTSTQVHSTTSTQPIPETTGVDTTTTNTQSHTTDIPTTTETTQQQTTEALTSTKTTKPQTTKIHITTEITQPQTTKVTEVHSTTTIQPQTTEIHTTTETTQTTELHTTAKTTQQTAKVHTTTTSEPQTTEVHTTTTTRPQTTELHTTAETTQQTAEVHTTTKSQPQTTQVHTTTETTQPQTTEVHTTKTSQPQTTEVHTTTTSQPRTTQVHTTTETTQPQTTELQTTTTSEPQTTEVHTTTTQPQTTEIHTTTKTTQPQTTKANNISTTEPQKNVTEITEMPSQTTTTSGFQCQENEFKCVDSDNECLPLALKCNGWQDCDDGFDEQNCEIPCTDDEYKCTGSGGCIPGNWQCDGMPDCSDGSDELECGGDGGWAEWSNWGECNVNCGTGEQTRSRYCEGEESQCVGEVIEYRLCHRTPCYMEGSDGCGTRSVVTQARIVGGENASPGAWPWQAQLYYIPWDFVACGGTLIGARHVISAAHCFQGDMSNSAHWKVRLGRHTLSGDTSFDSEAIEVDVAEVIVHPQYSNQVELNNDIAILVLAEDVIPSNKINYACMDIEHETHFDQHSYCFISGWGYTLTFSGKQSEILQEAMVPLISQELCNAPSSYDGLLTENMMCAGYLGGGVDACQGDSGGPLVCIDKGDDGLGYWYLTGITSFGNGCANAGFPGVYTKISQYIEWLGDHGAL